MPFIELLLLNMAAAAGIAAIGDISTQHVEMCLKRKKQNKRSDDDNKNSYKNGDLVLLRKEIGGVEVDVGSHGVIIKVEENSFLMRIDDIEFRVYDDEIEVYEQQFTSKRTLRMMTVAGLVFDPLSFTWYYVLLPLIVPGHVGSLTANQMTHKILWDIIVYGGVVSFVSIAANALLQNPTRKHLSTRIKSDFPLLYFGAMALSIPADIPVFLLVPAKYQTVCFKGMDVVFMLIVSFVVNRELDEGSHTFVERKDPDLPPIKD